jgi:hypothetical protein
MSLRPPFLQRPEHAGLAGRAGLAATGVSVALTFTVALAGTSVMEPPYPGRPGQPPWAFSAHFSPYLAVALAGAALAAGTAGLALTMRAMRGGWVIPAWPILVAGLIAAAALTLVPPFGSSDPLSYAAYGRMLVTGHNPYAIGPDVLARLGDPVARAVQDWYTTPSDYGTVATGGQALASLIGGTSARLAVFVLSLLNLGAFAGTGLLLQRLGRGDRHRQIRAALLWTCNPLLLQVLVAGEHADSQAVFFGVAAVAVFGPLISGAVPRFRDGPAGAGGTASTDGTARRMASRMALRAAAAGALIGLGFAVKVTIVLLGAGLAVAAVQAFAPRRAPGGGPPRGWAFLGPVAGGLATGFAVIAGTALALGGRDGFHQTVQASSMVSIGSPWRAIRTLLHLGISEAAAGDAIKIAAVVLAVVLAVLLLRGLPPEPPETSPQPPVRQEYSPGGGGERAQIAADPHAFLAVPARTGENAAGRAALALVLAWLLAWPYVLPWYDALAWALLPLVAASGLDWLLLARTSALAFGYLPARVAGVVMPGGLDWLRSVVRTGVTPAVLAIVIVWVVVSMRRGRASSARPGGRSGPDLAGPAGPAATPPSARQPATDGRAG